MDNKQLVTEAVKKGFQQKVDEWVKVEEIIEEKGYKSILEIGNYKGDSLRYFSTRFKQVFGLDINPVKDLPDNATHIVGDSKKVVDEVYSAIVKGRRKGVDVLLIDGDHSYEGVKADFENYKDLVKKGGMIVIHDIIDSEYHRSAGCFVSKLWQELKDENSLEFISAPFHWGGIGVITSAEMHRTKKEDNE